MGSGYIIGGDIGGTKTIIALAEADDGRVNFTHQRQFESGKHDSLEEIIGLFMGEVSINRGETAACFGIAGAIKDGRCKTTNLPWEVDEKSIKEKIGLKEVKLINDFKSIGYGIPYLGEEDLNVLNEGYKDDKGPIAIIGAGTGLGEGVAFYSSHSRSYQVLPSEGGHSTFSPAGEEELGLHKYLMEKFGHVSFERLLSGQGFVNIYNYLADTGFAAIDPDIAVRMEEEDDPAAVISSAGLVGKDALCIKALDMFVSIYGTEAGNLALKFLPSGGLYISGGIATKISKKLKDGIFMKSFLNKGRMSDFLKNIPLYIVLNPQVGLVGSVAKGSQLFNE